jgi:hypothetical protein
VNDELAMVVRDVVVEVVVVAVVVVVPDDSRFLGD